DLNVAQFRVTIPPCAEKVEKDGDGVLKLSPWLYPPVDALEVPIIYDLGGFRYRY
ncbi:hypothetical protein HWQ67_19025, partial [Candidatus Magnetobacterium casensis]|nr:hypothetical protein [Candidatus Magnetobacterium casensis]